MNNQRSLASIIIVLIIIAFLAGGIFTWKYFSAPKTEEKPEYIVKTGKFTFPIGGEDFIIGENQKITWQMPNGNVYYHLDIDLMNERGEKLGSIINWNWVKYNPINSTDWDAITIYNPVPIGGTPEGQTVYELKPDENIKIQPGNYKLILRYQYSPSGMQGSFESNYFEIVD